MNINDTGVKACVKKVDMYRKLNFGEAKSESDVSWHEILCITLYIDIAFNSGILNDFGIAGDIDIDT